MKGESLEDNLRTISSYFDLLITRHPLQGYSERASYVLGRTRRPIPVINAGSGKDQHPTQALLDIFSLRRSFENLGGLENKTIMMVGDLKRGRTVRSLAYLLSNFPGVKLIFASPSAFKMESDITDFLTRKNIEFKVTEDFEGMIGEADAIYMTRIQDEHDKNGESNAFDISKYSFRTEHLKILKPNGILLHPLPRRQEIAEEVDQDPRAMYWRQVRNGMWTRVALIAHVFGIDQKILDR
jgi:aspartate carbamoyltransferase catalytic subunit